MEKISLNDNERIIQLSEIASIIIKEHYDPIIGKKQNDYMISKFQSVEGIKRQMEEGHLFYVKMIHKKMVGYVSFHPILDRIYLDKIYLLKEFRNQGYGKEMFAFVVEQAKGYRSIFLNVNKFNYGSINIYKYFGFSIIGEEKKYIGMGYYMDDYVMEYLLDGDDDAKNNLK